jgi:hypothetical protein
MSLLPEAPILLASLSSPEEIEKGLPLCLML